MKGLPNVVAMISAGNGMGKTLAADYLVEQYDYIKLAFAAPMKDMLRVMLFSMGFDNDRIKSMMVDKDKEKPIPGLTHHGGVTPRDLMISLGTGWGRDMVYQGLWCDVCKANVEALLDKGKRVVIDDTRFNNERFMLTDITNGLSQFTELRREVAMDPAKQVGDLNMYRTANVVVENDGTVDELYSRLDVTLFNYEEHFGLR